MSELINTTVSYKNERWKLLVTVSALALTGAICISTKSNAAEDGDRPTVWIELGGQLERVDGGQTAFAPPFFTAVTDGGFKSPLAVDRPARYSEGLEGKISFLPDGSDWVFAGSIRYGRSNGNRFLHQQPNGQVTRFAVGTKYLTKTAAARYAETKAENSESHLIVDFQVGKDVGLGMFGRGSTSTINFGLRFAQFSEKSDATIRARPDVHLVPEALGKYQIPLTFYHRYFGSAQRSASFHVRPQLFHGMRRRQLLAQPKTEKLPSIGASTSGLVWETKSQDASPILGQLSLLPSKQQIWGRK